jgi:hypothetical protein
VDTYNLNAMDVDSWVYIEIRKGMYGLKQSGLLANQLLQKTLDTIWLLPSPTYTRYMVTKNKTNCPLSLIVDDFAVKYVGKHHVDHLRDALM